jgi:aspartyl-tRNA(Asn)/glutamyl-tRNA(Gln) amidotransferase subunit B
LVLDSKWVDGLKAQLPELPDTKKERFIRDFKLSPYDAGVLVAEQESAVYFDQVAKGRKDPKLAANWVISELFAVLNRQGLDIAKSPVSATSLAGLLDLIENATISGRIAKDVFAQMVETGKEAAVIVDEKGLKQVTDTGAIEKAVDDVIAANQDKAEQVKGGKAALIGWFVGQVMKGTGGKANPAMVNEILKKKLGV